MERSCEAREFDLFLFGRETGKSKAVEPCEENAEKFFWDFALCVGCIEALEGIRYMAKKIHKTKDDA